MADDDSQPVRPSRSLEPGTIDHVRQNIGPIDPEEAAQMQKILGGDILRERVVPDTSALARKSSGSVIVRANKSASSSGSSASASSTSSPNHNIIGVATGSRKMKKEEELPEIPSRELKLMNRLMMSPEYEIKPNYGLFNFIFYMSAKNKEKLVKSYGDYMIKRHVDHMQAFISTVKTFIQLSPDTYKTKIAADTDLKFKFLRTVGRWTMKDIKAMAFDLEERSAELTVQNLIPFVREVYRMFITIYYIGEQQVPALIKEVYNDICAYPDVDKNKMQNLAKQGITEWLYIHNQVIKGMYPLLMRMSSSEFVAFPKFFTAKIAEILKFLHMTKFELLLPERNKKTDDAKKKAEEAKKKLEENRHIAGKKDQLVDTGLKILEQLFPQAGFSRLDEHPDLYPYFQPLYNFQDGFNMLPPESGVQVTLVLIRIIEDLFQGLHNVDFNLKADESFGTLKDDIVKAIDDWPSYIEVLFNKKLGDYLRNYVNSTYTKSDYPKSQFGLEDATNILWRIKFYYLPNFKFQQLILNKPTNDNPYRALYNRSDYLKAVLSVITRRIDENAAQKKPVLGVINPWDRYKFDLPNVVSKRLDVLLGAKKTTDSPATNANLIKYTLCVVSVLDWWINNESSPAYTCDPMKFYRISDKDGGPQFSVPVRSDQNALFAANIKKQMAAKQKAPQKK